MASGQLYNSEKKILLLNLIGSPLQLANERLARGRNVQDEGETKNLSDTFILGLSPVGILGGHHYYMERWNMGLVYTFTVGLFGVGWLMDIFTMPYIFKRTMKIKRGEIDNR